MDELLIARGFWGPRREEPERVADALLAFLEGLDAVVGESVRWSSPELPGESLTEAANARRVIGEAFRANTDAPQLGINQSYEGRGERLSTIRIAMGVGRYSESPNVHNSFVVRWQGVDTFADPILRQIVSAWDPDWGGVTSRSLRDALAGLQGAGKPGPDIGYLSYLSEGRAQALPGGLERHLVKLDDGGVVIGSGEGSGFLSVEKAAELARDLGTSTAFSPTPTSRSKF